MEIMSGSIKALLNATRISIILSRRNMSLVKNNNKSDIATKDQKAPLKFTKSAAYLDYKATGNFYTPDDGSLPKSHNQVLAASGILSLAYLFFLRDDIEGDGGKNLFKPIHETIPSIAIPMLQSTIVEHRRQGLNTQKLEKKLAEYMKEPEKHGVKKPKLVEN